MQQHNLEQGSLEWHQHRASHFNASDAPAMMGCSPYKSRTDLLQELKTGLTKDVDSHTQNRFDEGHRFEALARGIAESMLDDELYPITGTEGKLSASFDGLTINRQIAFEHKRINETYRACEKAEDLPLYLRVQMEQQLHVSGAKKTLFMATNWNDQDELIESVYFWYTPDLELREKIIAGWAQFEKDLAEYVPAAEVVEAKASAIMSLPAINIQIKGEVTASNLTDYKEAATLFVNSINTNLVTDQDFVDADASAKFCANAEKAIKNAKVAAISQTASIDELMRTLDFVEDKLRNTRLTLEKLVKAEKENRKLKIIDTAQDAYQFHLENLSEETWPFLVPNMRPNFAEAVKNKQSIKSMQDSVDTMLANAKAEAEIVAADLRKKIAWYKSEAADFEFLFSDIKSLINLDMVAFQNTVKLRIVEHLKREDEKAQAKAEAALRLEEASKQQAAHPVANDVPVDEVREAMKPAAKPTQPTDFEIVCAVAKTFGVNNVQAEQWILNMQLRKAA